MTTLFLPSKAAISAANIPPLTHVEAGKLSQETYARLLAVLESLSEQDWEQPTYCTEWNVRDMAAHLAGAVTGSCSVKEFLRQNVTHPSLRQYAMPVDGTNKLQIAERVGKTTAELVAEFRQNGQTAVHNRHKLPWFLRKLPIPMGPSLGIRPLEYLMDTLYPRDQWMHQYDLCAATGKEMIGTPEHDGRIVALVVRDVAQKLQPQLASRSLLVHLTGPAGGNYHLGRPSAPDCTLEIDTFDFNLRASGRISVAEAWAKTAVSGNNTTATWFLTNCEVMY